MSTQTFYICTKITFDLKYLIITKYTFQGDRFGGALDAAAKLFSDAYDSGMIPMEFVNSMRKKGQLIMGIGHRVKSVSNLTQFGFCLNVTFMQYIMCLLSIHNSLSLILCNVYYFNNVYSILNAYPIQGKIFMN